MSPIVVRLLKLVYRANIRMRVQVSTLIGRLRLSVLARAQLGSRVVIAGPLRLHAAPGAQLVVGDGVRIQSGFRYNPVGSECTTGFWVGPNGRLEIGAGAGLSGVTVVCLKSVTIGERTYIGGGTRIYDTDFHPIDPITRRERPDDIPVADVHIGAECFIGGYSIILKGVTIGAGAVVGAGSVVAKDIPAGEIWAGNPARRIRSLGDSPGSGSQGGRV